MVQRKTTMQYHSVGSYVIQIYDKNHDCIRRHNHSGALYDAERVADEMLNELDGHSSKIMLVVKDSMLKNWTPKKMIEIFLAVVSIIGLVLVMIVAVLFTTLKTMSEQMKQYEDYIHSFVEEEQRKEEAQMMERENG